MKFGTIKQKIVLDAKPLDVFDIFMDSKKYSKLISDEAKIGKKVGDKFSVFFGWGVGVNLEIIAEKKIVQSWLIDMTGWPRDHFSKVSFSFAKNGNSTVLTFVQTRIPENCVDELKRGWQ